MIGKIKYHLAHRTLIRALKEKCKNFIVRTSYGTMIMLRLNKLLGKCYLKQESINIDISRVCNLNCVMCPDSSSLNKENLHEPGFVGLQDYIAIFDNAVRAGFTKVELCPAKGEIFLNKDALAILKYVNNTPLEYFRVVTNFIPLKPDDIQEIFTLDKLNDFQISIYGHDEESFKKITRKGVPQYDKLLDNINVFIDCLKNLNRPFKVVLFWWRGDPIDFNHSHGKLKETVKELAELADKVEIKEFANKIAGMSEELIINEAGFRVKNLKEGKLKLGPCRYLFSDFIVNTAGKLSTCRCYDRAGKLFLGNIDDMPLEELISGKNPLFRRIIEQQNNGIFSYPCDDCSEYKSIYYPAGKAIRISFSDLMEKYRIESGRKGARPDSEM